MLYMPSLGEGGLSEIFADQGSSSLALLKYCEIVMRGPSPLTPGQRELIAGFTSGLNDCNHCYGTHTGTAEAFGLAEGLLVDLVADVETAELDEKTKAVLRYVRKLTLTPSRMTKADAEAFFAAGWDEQALHDAVAVCSLFNFFNRYTNGLGVDTPRDAARQRGHMLAELGYAGLAEKLGLAKADEAA